MSIKFFSFDSNNVLRGRKFYNVTRLLSEMTILFEMALNRLRFYIISVQLVNPKKTGYFVFIYKPHIENIATEPNSIEIS